jgi:hypothetical protein
LVGNRGTNTRHAGVGLPSCRPYRGRLAAAVCIDRPGIDTDFVGSLLYAVLAAFAIPLFVTVWKAQDQK